jgi:hypothetical protein
LSVGGDNFSILNARRSMTRANILIARRNRRREGFPRCNERLSWRRNVIIRPHERPSCVRRPIRTFSSSSLFIFPVIEFFLVVLSAPSRLFYGFLDITLHGPLYTLTCDFLKIEPATAALPKLLSSTILTTFSMQRAAHFPRFDNRV